MTYTVINSDYDASRPWAVMVTFTNCGCVTSRRKIIGRYATKAQAQRRANDRNKGR